VREESSRFRWISNVCFWPQAVLAVQTSERQVRSAAFATQGGMQAMAGSHKVAYRKAYAW